MNRHRQHGQKPSDGKPCAQPGGIDRHEIHRENAFGKIERHGARGIRQTRENSPGRQGSATHRAFLESERHPSEEGGKGKERRSRPKCRRGRRGRASTRRYSNSTTGNMTTELLDNSAARNQTMDQEIHEGDLCRRKPGGFRYISIP